MAKRGGELIFERICVCNIPGSYKADERLGGSQELPGALESHHIEGCWPILKELFQRRKKKYKKKERIVFVLMTFIYFPDYKSNICSLLNIWKKLPPKELRKKAKSPGLHPQLLVFD